MTKEEDKIQKMMKFIFGYQITQSIYAACKLKIAEKLNSNQKNVTELSRVVNCHTESLYRLLRALSSLGIFNEVSQNVFENNELSSLLIPSHPNSLISHALIHGEQQYRTWHDITHSIITGENAFFYQNKVDYFTYINQRPEFMALFNQYLNSNAYKNAKKVLSCYDFSSIKKLIDIGGGNGIWLNYLLDEYENMNGIVFDTEENTKLSKKSSLEKKYTNRIDFKGGDFFKTIPKGGDLYFLSNIIHDWNDEKAFIILNKCHEAMSKSSKLLLIERILLPKNQPDYGKWMDLNMLIMLNGRERTKDEYEKLLVCANFKLSRIISTPAGLDIIEAVPM